MLIDHPQVSVTQPFQCVSFVSINFAMSSKHFFFLMVRIDLKETNFSYSVEKVFQHDIPALHHGNDGLIYTCVSTPYIPGTDRNMSVVLLGDVLLYLGISHSESID
jgi:mRNA guanylyltransferase